MNSMDWYAETVKSDTINAVASKSGIVYTTLSRQLERKDLSPETVVAVAAAYGRDVLDALVISGLITRDQIKRHGIRAALNAASDREIADEVWKRLNDGREHGAFDEPISGPDTPMSDPHLKLVANEENPRDEQEGSGADR